MTITYPRTHEPRWNAIDHSWTIMPPHGLAENALLVTYSYAHQDPDDERFRRILISIIVDLLQQARDNYAVSLHVARVCVSRALHSGREETPSTFVWRVRARVGAAAAVGNAGRGTA